MLVWLIFSAAAFAAVRFVDASGWFVVVGCPVLATFVYRYSVASKANRLEREAGQHAAEANRIARAAGQGAEFAAGFAGGYGDAMLENASDLGDLVIGGLAKIAEGVIESGSGGPEAAAHRRAAAAKINEARELRGGEVLVFMGVIVTSGAAVACGHFEVFPTPASIARDRARHAEYVREHRDGQRAAQREAEVARLCTAVNAAVTEFVAIGSAGEAAAKRRAFAVVLDREAAADAAAHVQWADAVAAQRAVAASALGRLAVDGGTPSRNLTRTADREVEAWRRAVSGEIRAGRPPLQCGL